MLSVKQGGIKYHFGVFGMTPPGIERKSLWRLANILLIRPDMMMISVNILNSNFF